jgi:hypothetical protein
LAVLAEAGVPLSTPICFSQRDACSLEDVLRDSVANFHLDQEELEWTACAYARYVPPAAQWTNKFGQTFTFNELADALLERSLVDAPCAGAHILESLTALYRIDSEYSPILSASHRARLGRRLHECVAAALRSQSADGSWDANWHKRSGPAAQLQNGPMASSGEALSERLLATGHLSEWLLNAPNNVEIAPDVLRRSTLWLENALDHLPRDQFVERFCPVSHAVHVLSLACEEAPRSLAMAR